MFFLRDGGAIFEGCEVRGILGKNVRASKTYNTLESEGLGWSVTHADREIRGRRDARSYFAQEVAIVASLPMPPFPFCSHFQCRE